MPQSSDLKPKVSREPPPTLFLGPPSQNASHVSLPGIAPAPPPNQSNISTRTINRQRSYRGSDSGSRIPSDNLMNHLEPVVGRPAPRQGRQDSEVKKQADRTDAMWAEMQGTLEEVELSAVNGTHVFGPEHSKALEELRAAQIGLAQAWARSEADDQVESADKESKGFGSKGGGIPGSEGRSALDTAGTDGKGSTAANGSQRAGSSGASAAERVSSKLEQETETDIILARRRTEANDRYFQKVNSGVLDVVAKLEEVASAMRAVEQESRDIWGESESPGGSVTS
ncbi:hypothetical protein BJ878DRAFT_296897 [Calycina marina]|uniref:Uncharacterized protein n=1 Tax=Calycina marina TaxID=1763456 RepID=A0A9P7Z6K7_9HELO|nr:hypothetical protein BJ878DRAFT_296897 [Calycina marina]